MPYRIKGIFNSIIMKYKRILIKLSGEVLGGKQGFGLDQEALMFMISEIKKVIEHGAEVGIVIGGGNIFRGSELNSKGFSNKIKGDYMGMLATIINGIALQTAFSDTGIKSKLITAFHVDKVGEIFNQDKVLQYLKEGNITIFTGGTSNPLFTTDSAAALRAVEIKADALLKATKVDGIYSSDPFKYSDAIKYNTLTFNEAIDKQLKVMDLTAFTICRENKMPIIVFDSSIKDNLLNLVIQGNIGTLVY